MQRINLQCDIPGPSPFLSTPPRPPSHHAPFPQRQRSLYKGSKPYSSRNKLLVVALLIIVSLVTPTVSAAGTTKPTTPNKPTSTVVKSTSSIHDNDSNSPLPTTPSNTVTPSTIFILPTQAPPVPQVPNSPNNNSTLIPNPQSLCPPPLILNIHLQNSTIPTTEGSSSASSPFCTGPCCIPCPASSVFYEPHKLTNIYTLTSILRALSAGLSAILTFCYLILPNRRRHPHLIVLCLVTFMAPWEAIGTIWLQKREELLCKSPYEVATMSNSWLCGFQGLVLMYLVLLMLCFGVLLIANLHFLTVFRSTWLQTYMTPMIGLSFFLPLALVIPVAVRGQIENPGFGSVCFVAARAASPFFFFPLAVIVCSATLLHLGTIAFMIRTKLKSNASSSVGDSASATVSKNSGMTGPNSIRTITLSTRQRRLQTAREISVLLKQQWRPGLLALCLLFIDMIYWLFYFTEAKKLEKIGPTTPWFINWIQCLTEQAALNLGKIGATTLTEQQQFQWMGETAQRTCASIAEPFVPSFSWAALSDILPATFGFFLMIIFGTKIELWQDVAARLLNRRRKEKSTEHAESTEIQLERLENARRASPGGADGDHDPQELSNGFDLYYHYHGSPSVRRADPNGALDIRDFYAADGSWTQSGTTRQEPTVNQPDQDALNPTSEAMHYGGKQPRKKSLKKKTSQLLSSGKMLLGSSSIPSSPSPPTSPASGAGALDSVMRKTSVSFANRDPAKNGRGGESSTLSPMEPRPSVERKQRLFEERQNQAQMIIEGSAPWPSWPSSTFTTLPSASTLALLPSSPPSARLPPIPTSSATAPKKISPLTTPPSSGKLSIELPRSPITTRMPSTAGSPVYPSHRQVHEVSALSSKGFYNSEDLAAPPINLRQPSNPSGQRIAQGGNETSNMKPVRGEKLTVPSRTSSRAQLLDRLPGYPVQCQDGHVNPIALGPDLSPLPAPLIPRKSNRRGKGTG